MMKNYIFVGEGPLSGILQNLIDRCCAFLRPDVSRSHFYNIEDSSCKKLFKAGATGFNFFKYPEASKVPLDLFRASSGANYYYQAGFNVDIPRKGFDLSVLQRITESGHKGSLLYAKKDFSDWIGMLLANFSYAPTITVLNEDVLEHNTSLLERVKLPEQFRVLCGTNDNSYSLAKQLIAQRKDNDFVKINEDGIHLFTSLDELPIGLVKDPDGEEVIDNELYTERLQFQKLNTDTMPRSLVEWIVADAHLHSSRFLKRSEPSESSRRFSQFVVLSNILASRSDVVVVMPSKTTSIWKEMLGASAIIQDETGFAVFDISKVEKSDAAIRDDAGPVEAVVRYSDCIEAFTFPLRMGSNAHLAEECIWANVNMHGETSPAPAPISIFGGKTLIKY